MLARPLSTNGPRYMCLGKGGTTVVTPCRPLNVQKDPLLRNPPVDDVIFAHCGPYVALPALPVHGRRRVSAYNVYQLSFYTAEDLDEKRNEPW